LEESKEHDSVYVSSDVGDGDSVYVSSRNSEPYNAEFIIDTSKKPTRDAGLDAMQHSYSTSYSQSTQLIDSYLKTNNFEQF